MPLWHSSLEKRKKTGGRKRAYRSKRAYERGGSPAYTSISTRKVKEAKPKGGILKLIGLSINEANVTDPTSQKTQKTEIRKVLENPANRDFQKRNIITKGAIIDTSLGKAKVTSRPGQHGTVNALLITTQQK